MRIVFDTNVLFSALRTVMTRRWIADWLKMGSASYLSALLANDDRKL